MPATPPAPSDVGPELAEAQRPPPQAGIAIQDRSEGTKSALWIVAVALIIVDGSILMRNVGSLTRRRGGRS
jgi:hypothetical protein